MVSSVLLVLVALFLAFHSGETLHLPRATPHGSASRRDALARAAGASAAVLGATAGAAPAVAAPPLAYQGVYTDPQHPKGYRILFGNDTEATLKLRDDPNGEELELPVTVSRSAGATRLACDFRAKGGPAHVVGVLGGTAGDDLALTFPDGNTWRKDTAGIAGVYAVSGRPGSVVAIRRWRFNELQATLIEGGATTATFGAKAGSQKAFFEYPGEFNKAGRIDVAGHTLSFRDGTVWTRY